VFNHNALRDDLARGPVSSLAKFPAGPAKIPSSDSWSLVPKSRPSASPTLQHEHVSRPFVRVGVWHLEDPTHRGRRVVPHRRGAIRIHGATRWKGAGPLGPGSSRAPLDDARAMRPVSWGWSRSTSCGRTPMRVLRELGADPISASRPESDVANPRTVLSMPLHRPGGTRGRLSGAVPNRPPPRRHIPIPCRGRPTRRNEPCTVSR
jgi:hypothetical protein